MFTPAYKNKQNQFFTEKQPYQISQEQPNLSESKYSRIGLENQSQIIEEPSLSKSRSQYSNIGLTAPIQKSEPPKAALYKLPDVFGPQNNQFQFTNFDDIKAEAPLSYASTNLDRETAGKFSQLKNMMASGQNVQKQLGDLEQVFQAQFVENLELKRHGTAQIEKLQQTEGNSYELGRYKQKSEELIFQNRAYENIITDLRQQIGAKEGQNQERGNELRAKTLRITQLEKNVEQYASILSQKQLKLTEAQNLIGQLSTQIQLGKFENERNELKVLLKRRNQDFDNISGRLLICQGELTTAQKQNTDLRMSISQQESKIEINLNQFRTLKIQKEADERRISKYQLELANLQEIREIEIIELQAQLDNTSSRTVFLESELLKVQDLNFKRDDMAEYKQSYEECLRNLGEANIEIEEYKEKLTLLEAEIKLRQNLVVDYGHHKAKISEHEASIQKMKIEYNFLNEKHGTKISEASSLAEKLQISIFDYQQLEIGLGHLQDQNNEFKKRLAEREEEIQYLTKQLEATGHFQGKIDLHLKEIDNLASDKENLIFKISNHKNQLSKVEFQHQQLQVKHEQIEAEILIHKGSKVDLLQKIEILIKENSEAKSEYKAACVQIKQLEDTLELKDQNLKNRVVEKDNSSSIRINELLEQEALRLQEIRSLTHKIQELNLALEMRDKDYSLKHQELEIRHTALQGQLQTKSHVYETNRQKQIWFDEARQNDVAQLKLENCRLHEELQRTTSKLEANFSIIEQHKIEIATHKSRNDLLDGEFQKLLSNDDDLTALRYALAEAQNQLKFVNEQWSEATGKVQDSENKRNELMQKMSAMTTEYENFQQTQFELLQTTIDDLSKKLVLAVQEERQKWEKRQIQKCNYCQNGPSASTGTNIMAEERSVFGLGQPSRVTAVAQEESKSQAVGQNMFGMMKSGGNLKF